MASHPLAAGDIGGHQREGAEAEAEKEEVEHGGPLPARAGDRGTLGAGSVNEPFGRAGSTVKSA